MVLLALSEGLGLLPPLFGEVVLPRVAAAEVVVVVVVVAGWW